VSCDQVNIKVNCECYFCFLCDLTCASKCYLYDGRRNSRGRWKRGLEKAGLENSGQKCRGGKRRTGKSGTVIERVKTRDWKTRHFKSMESVTKHKCSNNVERESKATAQKHSFQKPQSWDLESFGRQGHGYPICRTDIQVILSLFWF